MLGTDLVSEFFPASVLVAPGRPPAKGICTEPGDLLQWRVGAGLLHPEVCFRVKELPAYPDVLSLVPPQQSVTTIKHVSAEYTQTKKTETREAKVFFH